MKYKYKYCIYTNNLNYGYMKVKSFDRLKDAKQYLYFNGMLSSFNDSGYLSGYGCVDIVKKRYYL